MAVPANAVAAIRIKKMGFDPSGSDLGSNSSLKRECIVLKNAGNSSKGLKGWKITDRGPRPHVQVRSLQASGWQVCDHPHAQRRGHRSDRFWDLDNYVWNNDGDRATLVKPAAGSLTVVPITRAVAL